MYWNCYHYNAMSNKEAFINLNLNICTHVIFSAAKAALDMQMSVNQ